MRLLVAILSMITNLFVTRISGAAYIIAIISCFPVGQSLEDSREVVQFWYFFFPYGGGEFLVLETTGPRGHTHGICSGLKWPTVHRSRPKFLGAISFRFNVRLLYHVVGVHTFPREGIFLSLILCPLLRGFEWFLFVLKNN